MLPSHLNGHSPLARRRPRLSAASPPATEESPAAAAAAPLEEHDRIYFQSYSHIGIHETMIKDRVRTDAYRTAIMHHQKFIEGKVVMDVGCGTGILSVFCALAGAKRVEFNGPAESSHNFPPNSNPLDTIKKKRRRASDTVMLSTAPEDESTHWQQAILYFCDPVEVKQDQIIEGSVTVSQGEENPCFLNIHLECSTGGQTLVKDCAMR